MKLLIASASALVVSATAIAQSVPSPSERLYSTLGIESVLNELDATAEQALVQQAAQAAEQQRSRSLSKAEREQLVLAIKSALVKRGPIDHAAAKAVYLRSLTSNLSPDDLEVAIRFYATPAGKRIHFAVIEAEKAVSQHLEEVDAELPPIQLPILGGNTTQGSQSR